MDYYLLCMVDWGFVGSAKRPLSHYVVDAPTLGSAALRVPYSVRLEPYLSRVSVCDSSQGFIIFTAVPMKLGVMCVDEDLSTQWSEMLCI